MPSRPGSQRPGPGSEVPTQWFFETAWQRGETTPNSEGGSARRKWRILGEPHRPAKELAQLVNNRGAALVINSADLDCQQLNSAMRRGRCVDRGFARIYQRIGTVGVSRPAASRVNFSEPAPQPRADPPQLDPSSGGRDAGAHASPTAGTPSWFAPSSRARSLIGSRLS